MTDEIQNLYKETRDHEYENGELKKFHESFGETLPLAIFPEIHAITANYVTRNSTYYPTASLKGKPEEGTGLSSWYYPYPIPVIRDHADGTPSFFGGGETVQPFGRVYNSSYVASKKSESYIKLVPVITDPWAMEMILTQRWLTVSISSETDEVYCSICEATGKKKQNLIESGRCEHYRGESYEGQLCYWIMGPIKAREISFVNVPSDPNARVITASLDPEKARALLAGTDGAALVDLATGSRESQDLYRRRSLGVSSNLYDRLMKKAMLTRQAYERVCGESPTLGHLTGDEDKIRAVRNTMKGL